MNNIILVIGNPNTQRVDNILNKIKNNPLVSFNLVLPIQLKYIENIIDWSKILCILNLSYASSRIDIIALKHRKRVFNSLRDCKLVQNKLATYMKLKNKIAQPKTYTSIDDIKKYPIVGKYIKGSLGQQVELLNNLDEAILFQAKYGIKNVIFQQYIKSSYGIHLRAYCIGGKCVCAYNITNNKDFQDFKSNLASGNSHIEKVEINDNLQEKIDIIYKEIPLDNMGIDFLYGPNKELILCEINAFPLIGGPTMLNVDVHKMYIDYIVNEMLLLNEDYE